MNQEFLNPSISRALTQSTLYNTTQGTGIRYISMASVVMASVIGNKFLDTVLNNGEVTFDDIEDIAQFVYLHAGDKDEVTEAVAAYQYDPAVFKKAVYQWAMTVTPEQMYAYIKDIIKDKKHIANSKSKVKAEKGKKKGKTKRSRR